MVIAPGPGIAEPERGEQVQRSPFRPPVGGAETNEDILRIDLGVLDRDVEVAIFRKNARVDQFILRLALPPAAIRRPGRKAAP